MDIRRINMKIKLDLGAFMPTKAHKTDAGWDLYAPYDFVLKNHIFVDTGVHIEIPQGYVGFIKSKSGLNSKHNIIAEGVIDCGYTGAIGVKLHKLDDEEYVFHRGDKITQLVILPISLDDEMELVDSLDATERGNGGFGSSGK